MSGQSAVLAVIHQIGNHTGIGQRRGVAKLGIIVGRDLAKNPAHDLARPGLRKLRRPLQQVRRGDRADLLAGPLPELGRQLVARLAPLDQRDIGVDALCLLYTSDAADE